jgi:alpha-glucosidase (family GH31 glycosyl hydrolase)
MKPFKFFSLPVFLLGGSLFVHAQINDPKANPSAVVTLSEVRFTVLTPQLFRLEWSKKGEFEDKASLVFINRNLPAPKFIVDDKTDWLTITTEKLTLRYKKGSGKFTSDNLLVSFSLNGRAVTWHPGMEDPLNLKGTTRTLDGANGEKDVNLEQGLVSRSGWSLIDDSEKPLFDGSEWDWVAARPSGERQDWYFLGYGHEYKKALNDFTLLAGKIPMPPRFAFGYWWSRYWTYSDSELRTLIADMRRYDVPIDVLIIDMDWHETYGLSVHGTKIDPFGQAVGWTGYTWNRGLFPDPERFLKWTKEKNLKTALNLHPASGIAPMEEKYTEFAKVFGFDTIQNRG